MTRLSAFSIALIGLALLAAMDAVVKHLTGAFPIWQIVFLRYSIGLVFTAPLLRGNSAGGSEPTDGAPGRCAGHWLF